MYIGHHVGIKRAPRLRAVSLFLENGGEEHKTYKRAYLFCVTVLRSSHGFSRKRETARSLTRTKLVGDERSRHYAILNYSQSLETLSLLKKRQSKRWTLIKRVAAVFHYKTFCMLSTQFCMHVFLC